MIPGFISVDCGYFYREVWPRIGPRVDAIHSNLTRHQKHGDLPLVIYWGYRGDIRDENLIVAVSLANEHGPDEHWIATDLAS